MKTLNRGKLGELEAAVFLRKNDYEILCANYRTRFGEIDIIAYDKEYIVFIEVKTRAENSYFLPREAVTKTKQHKIILVAQNYLSFNIVNLQPRFDVIEITTKVAEEFKVLAVNHIKNAFML